ncbi:MAG TPA: hypothetical protein VGJ98_02400 [Candidatus Eisenbacteria bacterium]|jgi:hypothetical protein
MNAERWNTRPRAGDARFRLVRISLLAALWALAWGAQSAAQAPSRSRAKGLPAAASSPHEQVERMLARLLRAPEFHSHVLITRSDPFGGPPERTAGRIWFLPGRGLRFKHEERSGEDIVVDREKSLFLVYRPSERVLYRADWDRAPARMKSLIMEPERILDADYRAVRERRIAGGAWREGYRIHRSASSDSLPNVSVWVAADPATGLPRWVSAGGEEDSVEVEFRSIVILSKANPRDLALNVPPKVRTEPLDAREFLPGGESR